MDAESNQALAASSDKDDQSCVTISTAQFVELMKALDETRGLLYSLQQSDIESYSNSEPARPPGRHRKSWWGRHCWPNGRRRLYKNITLITIVLQFLNLIMLTVLDVIPKTYLKEHKMIIASSTTMITLQVANLVILILATGRLAKQVIHHNVNSFFLAQSYLATLLLYAGIYTLTYRLHRRSWKFLNEDLNSDPIQVFNLYLKFLFYSISTGTLCGSDNALPMFWYNHLFAGTQMLLSFCYFASILGMALSPKQSGEKPVRALETATRTGNSPPLSHRRPQVYRSNSSLQQSTSSVGCPDSSPPHQNVNHHHEAGLQENWLENIVETKSEGREDHQHVQGLSYLASHDAGKFYGNDNLTRHQKHHKNGHQPHHQHRHLRHQQQEKQSHLPQPPGENSACMSRQLQRARPGYTDRGRGVSVQYGDWSEVVGCDEDDNHSDDDLLLTDSINESMVTWHTRAAAPM